MNTVIQEHIVPNRLFNAPDEMYLRGRYWIDRKDDSINLLKGNEVSFNTYFNCLSVDRWRQECDITGLSVQLVGEGQFLLCVHHFGTNQPDKEVFQTYIDFGKGASQVIALPVRDDLQTGLIYLKCLALTDAKLNSIEYCTSQPCRTSVRLGLVITHFNRQSHVQRSVDRIFNDLLLDERFCNIKLVIVDNSSNLSLDIETDKIEVIKNKNVGGSGGFTRGLMKLRDDGYTHCCFMDDDASCEIESIRRTFAYFSFLKQPKKVSISGALIQASNPSIFIEVGGYFRRARYRPVHAGLDSRDPLVISIVNENSNQGNYGAWCFFAFAMRDIEHLPYPFFVRGDDVFFSIQNHLKVQTINGVCTWIEDFAVKESPLTRYLGLRATLTLAILQDQMSLSRYIKTFYRWHKDQVRSYNYSSAIALEEAARDVLKGPRIFFDDVSGSCFREKIIPLTNKEKLNVCPNEVQYTYPRLKHRTTIRLLKVFTLDGLLLPSFFSKIQYYRLSLLPRMAMRRFVLRRYSILILNQTVDT